MTIAAVGVEAVGRNALWSFNSYDNTSAVVMESDFILR